ncbi:MAG: hypothetical protein GY804_04605 [Alphaproteobacteria bacterium]|nr:hypothetical protein [Alphaproteobacteria bacterium]
MVKRDCLYYRTEQCPEECYSLIICDMCNKYKKNTLVKISTIELCLNSHKEELSKTQQQMEEFFTKYGKSKHGVDLIDLELSQSYSVGAINALTFLLKREERLKGQVRSNK